MPMIEDPEVQQLPAFCVMCIIHYFKLSILPHLPRILFSGTRMAVYLFVVERFRMSNQFAISIKWRLNMIILGFQLFLRLIL